MPGSRRRSDSAEMEPDAEPDARPGPPSRGRSVESGGGGGGARSRSFTLDDESLKYLTHEEKDVLLFFEETIDSLEEDFEEQVLCDSGMHSHSPGSLDGSASSHSEPGDVIDLVQPAPDEGGPECLPAGTEVAGAGPAGKEDSPALDCRKPEEAQVPPSPDPEAPEAPPSPDPEAPEAPLSPDPEAPEAPPVPPSGPVATPGAAPPRRELPTPAPPAEHPKLPRSVPTPLVIAQKMSEALPPTPPAGEGRPGERRTLPSAARRTGAPGPGHRPPALKAHRFPSNISVTNSAGKEFSTTISRAAVSVQERKARVLANINGVSFPAPGDPEGRAPGGEPAEQGGGGPGKAGPAREAVSGRAGGPPGARRSRGVQTDRAPPLANGFQSIHDALRSEPSALVSAGKTATFGPDPALAGRLPRQNASKSLCEHRPPDCGPEARRRAGSLPRAVGFRPQGVTVQFSGRGSTEEARREALRKLGLLKENL